MTKHRFSKWVYHRKLLIHEFWKDASHKSKALGLLLTDLLQAFDFFFCEPLNFISLEFVSGSFIKSKLDSFFSFRENILSGVLQGYISWIYFYSTMKRLGRGGGAERVSLTAFPSVLTKICFSEKGWSSGFLRLSVLVQKIWRFFNVIGLTVYFNNFVLSKWLR